MFQKKSIEKNIFGPDRWLPVLRLKARPRPRSRDASLAMPSALRAGFGWLIAIVLCFTSVSKATGAISCDCEIMLADDEVICRSLPDLENLLNLASPDCLNICISGSVIFQGPNITDSVFFALKELFPRRVFTSVSKGFSIEQTSLSILPELLRRVESVDSSAITIVDNPWLNSVSFPFYKAKVIGGLQVSRNEKLASVLIPDGLEEVLGGFVVLSNPDLQFISGLDNILTFGEIYVRDNSSLKSLEFQRIHPVYIEKNIVIADNSSVDFSSIDISAFQGHLPDRHVSKIDIHSNENVTTISGPIEGVLSIASINIASNSSLKFIFGFGSILSVSGRLRIGSFQGSSQQLVENNVLASVSEIGTLSVSHNPNLQGLDFLVGLYRISRSVFILNNASLCTCALNTISGLLETNSTSRSRLAISGNPVCCSSKKDVATSCNGRCAAYEASLNN